MPFLFPALASAACDLGILYLGHRNYLREKNYHSGNDALSDGHDDGDDDTSRHVYHYGYIVMLAAIRLFLLLVPLPYHSFFGKALRCPIVYRLFYGATVAFVILHALTLLMIDPASLSSLLKALATYSNDENANSVTMHHILVTRSLWVALVLTLVSTLNHIALFFHVRSTAPRESEFSGGRRRPRVLLYYAKEKKQQLDHHGHSHNSGSLALRSSKEHTEREGLLSGSNGTGGTAATAAEDDNSGSIGLPMGTEDNQVRRNRLHSHSGRALKEMSDKLMMQIQIRLLKAKLDWTKRLEDYQERLRTAAAPSSSSSSSSNADQNHSHNHLHHISLNNSNVAPFRVILELFAGDNNFFRSSNDHGSITRLDDVYDRDDGAALMLFVPQLLSFLLHGAYESSHQLEEWILETCRKNLFFAHKCYWFLRAWSLETSSVSIDGNSNKGDHLQLLSPQQVTRLSHSSSLTSFATQEDDPGSKLLPEERAVIEELMRKIMKCGEQPARLLHFGSTVGKLTGDDSSTATGLFPFDSISNQYSSSTLIPSGAAKSNLIPVNPLTGVPSPRHFNCLTAHKRHGFLPLDNGAALSASYNQSVLNGDPCGTSYFDSCPVFMDALITIADNLFKVPRHLRKVEFEKQLRILEVEALPCNEIYIPLQDLHHRVWRIVAEESIPLSTKERVPCIVCLEVLTYTPDQQAGDRDIGNIFQRSLTGRNKSSTVSEREMVEAWRNSRRDPYRRESAFNRVTQGMGKLPDKMKESMQEMQVSMQEMQEQIRYSITHMRERADSAESFWPAIQNLPGPSEYDCLNQSKTSPEIPKRELEEDDIFFDSFEDSSSITSPKKTVESPSKGLTPTHARQPVTPKTPRSSTTSGAMGQWTKSPGPITKSKHPPSRIIDFSDSTAEDLAAPTMDTNQPSYETDHGGSTMSRRRFGNGETLSMRARTLKVDTRVSYNDDDDDENDFTVGQHEHYGDNHDAGLTTTLSNAPKDGHSKPPTTPAKPPPVVFKENWKEKEDRLRSASAYGNHPGWKLLPVLVKSNDDLRQEQLASQLIQRMALILARDQIPVWLCPYEILALEASGGIIEAIPDTISLASLKKNDSDYTDLKGFFGQYFCEADRMADAKANFCESLAAYSMVCFLLQIKDRHNGNILLDNRGHLIHIDFGFFFLSSPGKNTGFESAPFKLNREFVGVLGGPDSHHFGVFRTLCYRTFLSLRKHCHEIILLVEMLQLGNENLACFRGRPDDAIRELRQRFRLDLNDRACLEYVNALIDESLENWRTNWYDRYQRYCVGVL